MSTRISALVIAGVLAIPGAASAADPVATAIRIGDHAGFVRIVLDRSVTPPLTEFAIDSNVTDGTAVVDVPRTRRGTLAAVTRYGVTVTPLQRGSTLRLRISTTANRFKYYGDFTLSNRLVMDLWKARPRYPAAIRPNPGCLKIGSAFSYAGRVDARGAGRGIFEGQFTVAIRNSSGRIVGQRTPVFLSASPNGTWSTSVTYGVVRQQIGTLEAVDFGGRVGHLCIAQVPVILWAQP